ncbi:MAG: ribosome biogenesis GTPase Der [Spirochaetes bacterium]|nr:ribosome biogenesis GTPase Der [Spirochaetota bacterium]
MKITSDIKYEGLPSVVLAGRPNVGKSTLFNRLLRKRRAITDSTPGVTRDPIAQDCFIAGKPLKLIDTGGFKLEDIGSIDALAVEKTLYTIEKADLIVLLLEAGRITAEDEEFIALLRPHYKKLVVAVNKTEGGRLEGEAWNVMAFGFEKIFMISAEHGDNVGDLELEIVSRLDFSKARELREGERQQDAPIRIALLGKPNTGKSTLSNRLTSSNASIVSEIPGTTRDVVEGSFRWKNRDFVLLDTAGIRRKAKVSQDIEYYSVNRAIKTINEADIVILLIDANEGLTDQDKKIAALAYEKGRGIIMALNKWDQIEQVKNIFQAMSDRIRFMFGQMQYAPIVALSAKDGDGVGELLNMAVKMHAQLNTRIETSRLNAALANWLAEYPPPYGPRTRFKIKYVVQQSANPVKFIFFASRVEAVSTSYISYLQNKARKDLGFSLIPISVEIRAGSERKR